MDYGIVAFRFNEGPQHRKTAGFPEVEVMRTKCKHRISVRSARSITLVITCCAILTACAGMAPRWHTEDAPTGFLSGTRVLAEVTGLAPHEWIETGEGLFEGWGEKLAAVGYTLGDIADGSEISAWAYCYAHNSSIPVCANHGQYLAHVPEAFRGELRAESTSERGDLAEIELTATPDGKLVGKLVAVYRRSGDWGDCHIARWEDTSMAYALSSLGPPRALWIECDGAESDGWIRSPVRGAPPAAPDPVSTWIKLPGNSED